MSRLNEIQAQIGAAKLPPVHKWSPEISGDIDIRIDFQGNWFHESQPIVRHTLVQLFASVLWCEKGDYYLVTPVEKWRIQVEDVPFVVQGAEHVDGFWFISTNTGDRVRVSAEHPVELRELDGQQIPYIQVRYELWARVSRSIYVQWVEESLLAINDSSNPQAVCLKSGDYEFPVAAA